jgi:hypothetical protein
VGGGACLGVHVRTKDEQPNRLPRVGTTGARQVQSKEKAMTKDEALDKALYALEIEDVACRYMKDETPSQIVEAITAIKQARSAPVQEPVGYITQARCFVHLHECTDAEAKLYGWKALYTR